MSSAFSHLPPSVSRMHPSALNRVVPLAIPEDAPLPDDTRQPGAEPEDSTDRRGSRREGAGDGDLHSLALRAPLTRCLAMRLGAYENWVVRTVITPEGIKEVFGPP